MGEEVRVEVADGVLTLTLNRPAKKNAITQAMYADMAAALETARGETAVRCVLIRAEGDSFCAGNDMMDFAMQAASGASAADMAVFRFLKALAEFDKPLVAAVQGRAVGIGVTLLLHCDLAVAAEDALLSTPFVNLALAPEAASSRLLPEAIGHRRAFEMLALGRVVTGREAADWGLVNKAVPLDQLQSEAEAFARACADRAPGSIQATKRLMRDAETLWALMQAEGQVFAAQMAGPEAREAFQAFIEKRPARFTVAD
ncbi:enoyl-CoA hydratase [Brevundimonas sp. 2R-24]|uniref:Enoyl-CoA hydratase n=1 Tax=Peiella sedimenti TaxID=3061083 RepID=A0ABT8SI65_9CAUL|nr:enoyl-CoA hydratase [Caulobacteraceae bacterium XZ-24]